MPRSEVLRTRRLVLTSWLPGDVDALQKIHSDPATMRYVRAGRPETYPETVALIEEYIAQYELTGVTKWRLTDKDGQLVGRAGFGQLGNGRELGYTIRRSERGRGFASEIAAALVQWHLDNAGQVPLLAHVATPNTASIRVLEKVGFTYVSTNDYQGERCNLYVYPFHGHPPACAILPSTAWPPEASGATSAAYHRPTR